MRKGLPDIISIAIFLLITFIYFFTPTVQNKVLLEHDTAAGMGAGQEAKEYYEEHGERTRWTNSLFSGMPTYQISPSYKSTDTLKVVDQTYSLGLPKYMGLAFIMLLGFYLLLRSFKVEPLIACVGAILWAFSSYFFILIAAGHLWKFITLAYVPPTIAGIVWAYRKKFLLGGIVAALFASLQILSNHVQMTYYFLFLILFLVIAYFIKAYKNNDLKNFYKSTGVLIIAGLVAIAINSSTLYHTYQYSQHSNRGTSELSINNNVKSDESKKAYITQWSYGVDETLTLLIPNYKGGVSSPLALHEGAMEKVHSQYPQVFSYFTQYFGTQPFTAGPVYVGAFVLFLFFIGCFFVKGPIKWALIAGTIFSIVLAWGKNFMPITDFFIDYIPMYDKFRAVSSILVIAEFTIPLLAILGLVQLLDKVLTKDKLDNKQVKYITISFILTGGIALLIAFFPSISGPFISSNDINVLNQLPEELAPTTHASLNVMRQHLVQSDAFRSFFIILIGVAILTLFFTKKINKLTAVSLIAILCLADLWQVDKRYLNDGLFSDKQTVLFKQSEADKYILQDKDLSYRVLNLTSDTFNENNTSYWHKSIGGYNAAKLGRYQELIEYGIYPEINKLVTSLKENNVDTESLSVLNMLNTRYIILGSTAESVFTNNSAYGNAWLINTIKEVSTAEEELQALNDESLKNCAVINKQYVENNNIKPEYPASGSITLTQYSPNKLEYNFSSDNDEFVVFSEIYYPGWKAYIDNKELDIVQVNYVLRGVKVPKGKHQIVFEFNPTSIDVTEKIAYTALFILGVVVFITLFKRIAPNLKSRTNITY